MNGLLIQLRSAIVTLGGFGLAARSAMANRTHFVLQIFFMMLNDAVWLVFWLLLYTKTGDIRGWERDDFVTLFATVCAVAALSWGLFGGLRDTSRVITTGEIDALLVQPSPVLARMLVRRIDVPLAGDFVFGVILFATTSHASSVLGWLGWLAVCVVGGISMLAFLIAAQSLAFWMNGRSEASNLAANASLVFTMYPLSIFSGALKLALYTVVPVAFMTTIPASIVVDFDAGLLALLLGGTCVLVAVALLAWSAGVRHFQRVGA